MAASKNGHTETILLLLQNGALVNVQNYRGSSLVKFASQNGHTETVLQNGATATDKVGWYLHYL